MRLWTLQRRSLSFHWRTNLAVTLGVAVGTAALTGALLVGDSMRGSLREVALGRLGRVDYALVSHRFFREQLADDLSKSGSLAPRFEPPVAAILLRGGVVHADSEARANRVGILGITDRFWELACEGFPGRPASGDFAGRSVILNEPLAAELGASIGDDVLLKVGKPSAISTETLLGRRDDTTATLRLTVRAVVPGEGLGAFSLNPRQFTPMNAFVPLATLQRTLDKRGRANAILVAAAAGAPGAGPGSADLFIEPLRQAVTLADLGLRLRFSEKFRYVSVESESLLIELPLERQILLAANAAELHKHPIQTYLANRIVRLPAGPGRETQARTTEAVIPYSTVTAIEPWYRPRTLVALGSPQLQPGEMLLNKWAADDLGAKVGDGISLEFYLTGAFGRLETKTETFTLTSILPLEGPAADPGFTPEYKGVTDTDNLADWDPPFPMDLSLIRDKDEAYWDKYGPTPKAFITLEDGFRLWAKDAERFGRLTSVRLSPIDAGRSLKQAAADFEAELMTGLELKQVGLSFDPVRARMIEAGQGTTDFGGLFIGFSFFLIASAAMLVALLFRLGVERRAGEIGLLLSTGFSPRAVAKWLLTEGAVLAVIGGSIGIVGSLGYAWLMLAGLRTWWAEAANAPFLTLFTAPTTLIIGFSASFLVALLSIAWSIRGLTRLSPRSLLAGTVSSGREPTTHRRGRRATVIAVAAGVIAVVLLVAPSLTEVIPQAPAFFGSGAALLVAFLALLARVLHTEQAAVLHRPGRLTLARLGMRNARRRTGRSLLTAGLIASATFLIAALESFHLETDGATHDRNSGTGGFALFAEATAPLPYDLGSRAGRDALGISPDAQAIFDGVEVAGFRIRPGDESSCLNLYRPTKPRILGATDKIIERGGFRFSSTLAETAAERDNPWTLLDRKFVDGAIPVIGDESAVLWQLHLGLGKDLEINDQRGQTVTLRFVALLSGSMLQDELIIAESDFVGLFPSVGGHAFYLIDAPAESLDSVERTLEKELSAFGLDVGTSAGRLAAYLAVQNTYLSTFQALGGFGLVLGTIGLTAVLLRNVLERRGELALLRALGFSHKAVCWIVLAENTALLVAGLLAGLFAALVAVAPHIATRATSMPWLSLGLTLLGVLAVGIGAGAAATISTLRAPLLPALRAE